MTAWWPGTPALSILLVLPLIACTTVLLESEETRAERLMTELGPDARGLAERARQRSLESLPSGTTWSWQLDSRRVSGGYTPLRSFRIRTGHFCREFRETVTRMQEQGSRLSVACRNREGDWIVVSPGNRQD